MVKISFAMSISVERANGEGRLQQKKIELWYSLRSQMRMQQKHLQYLVGSALHWKIAEIIVWVRRGGGINSVWVRERVTFKSSMGTLTSFVVPRR
jgi:hypothetical protein